MSDSLNDNASGHDSLNSIRQQLRTFAAERDWEQFHTPKNLAMALAGEVGEVLEHFQWLTAGQSQNLSPQVHAAVKLELADVLMYLVRLADVLEIDLHAAVQEKLQINEQRYPAALAHGRAEKYDQL